jgi:glyoxylase-like metal-dependent hydrolase (beta-lactamase superfamily II)
MKILPLSEGSFTIDETKKFIPFNEEADQLRDRAKGSLLVEIQPFIVITSKDVLLLDAGLGFETDGSLQLYNNLAAAGIQTTDITKVLMSHLHKDHAGGVGVEREGLGGRLALPNATYYVQRKELEYAFEKGAPSYITPELEALRGAGNVQLLDGNGSIDGYIQYELSGAHCPWHQVFFIDDEDERIFFGGDEAPQLHQMKHKFAAKYDHDGKKAMELRQKWWEQGNREHWTFLFYHDLKNPVVKC